MAWPRKFPPSARAWLRESVLGLGLRDAHRIVQTYRRGGLLRADVDVERVETFTADLLDGCQDLLVGLMPNADDVRTQSFLQKHSDMLGKEYPFQIPMDLLFMYRSLGTVGGVVKGLDPGFDLSSAAAPFALRLFLDEWHQGTQERLNAVSLLGQSLLMSPPQLDKIFLHAQTIFPVPEFMNQQIRRPFRDMMVKAELARTDRDTFQKMDSNVQHLNRALPTADQTKAKLEIEALCNCPVTAMFPYPEEALKHASKGIFAHYHADHAIIVELKKVADELCTVA